MISRKAIMLAVFARVATLAPFQTTGRALKGYDEVKPPDQPALYQSEGRQEAKVTAAAGTKHTLAVEFTIYAHQRNTNNRAGDGDIADLLNDCIDAVVAAFAPDQNGVQTLGGIVTDCRIEGTIETDEGRLGDQAVAVIPLVIVATV